MILPLILASSFLLLAIFFLIYYLWQRHQVHQLKSQLVLQTEHLKQNSQLTEQMRGEIDSLQTKLQHTFEDPVTHLLSWELFEDRLQQNISESARYHLTLGVMYVDIDDFRMINDALSYDIGNKVLAEVGVRLRDCIRQVDSVTRFSKDTFVILLTQLSKPETAAIVAQRILQSLKEPFIIEGYEFYLTVGIGIAAFPTDAKDASILLSHADHALHLAKEKGTHLYQFYQEEMHAQSQRELVMNVSLSREQLFEEFILSYQPIIDTRQNTVFCMDALLQWRHPQLGLINTPELFNHAKKQHKLNAITEWMLSTTLKQFKQWQTRGFKPAYLGLPLLLSQLANSQFIYRLSQILQEHAFNPAFLIFEIKESNLPLESLQKAFNMLKYIGVKITMDDFGEDTFAMQYVKSASINYLKIAPSLLKDLESNEQTVALIKSLLYLGQMLSIEIIANGVESEQQQHLLTALGCHLMQGQLIGNPLSADEVIDKMTTTVKT